jgi:integrase/recombinase XerD
MQNKPLVDLLRDLEQEMLRLGYTQYSLQFYRRRWQMLLRFAQE